MCVYYLRISVIFPFVFIGRSTRKEYKSPSELQLQVQVTFCLHVQVGNLHF